MQENIEQFLHHLQNEKERSQHTIAAYRTDLIQFLKHLEMQAGKGLATKKRITALQESGWEGWQDVQTEQVSAYLDYLQQGSTYAASTVARKIATIKSFLHFLSRRGDIEHNPGQEIQLPKVEKTPPSLIDRADIERLLAEPAKVATPKGMRDQALLEVLYATGMRVSELVELNLDDVDVREGTVVCSARTERARVLPLRADSAACLGRYLRKGRQQLAKESGSPALFLNLRGKRLTRQGLWLILKEYVEAVGIETPVTPQTLRHSIATHLVSAGNSLKDVQKRLGHASLSSTQIYRKLSEEQMESKQPELTIDGRPSQIN